MDRTNRGMLDGCAGAGVAAWIGGAISEALTRVGIGVGTGSWFSTEFSIVVCASVVKASVLSLHSPALSLALWYLASAASLAACRAVALVVGDTASVEEVITSLVLSPNVAA